MGAHLDRMAAAAGAASALLCGTLTQPGADQRQAQTVLAEPGRANQQPGVAVLRQQRLALRGNPGRHIGEAHASQPLACTACNTSCQTASRVWWASMRAKRWGQAVIRCR